MTSPIDIHDTIAMIARDRHGHFAAAASTNGAAHKVAGRVGDASVAGAGIYVEDGVGGMCGLQLLYRAE